MDEVELTVCMDRKVVQLSDHAEATVHCVLEEKHETSWHETWMTKEDGDVRVRFQWRN